MSTHAGAARFLAELFGPRTTAPVYVTSLANDHGNVKTPPRSVVTRELEIVDKFAAKWDNRYASIAALWRRQWPQVIPFFAFPAEIRKVIYTTNAVESLNMSLRKALKPRMAFPSEEAALKVMYLALRNLIRKWEQVRDWKAALNCFTVLWQDRIRAASGV